MVKSTVYLAVAASICLAVAGCGSSMQHRQDDIVVIKKAGHGPPPHAPAHGYRHKHQADGVELVYDSGRGVYVVVDFPNHYFLDGLYLRYSDSRWYVSSSIDGDWKMAEADQVPPGLLAGSRGDWKHGRKRGHDK